LTIPGRIPLDPPFPKGDDERKRKLFCAPCGNYNLKMIDVTGPGHGDDMPEVRDCSGRIDQGIERS
jgi:hypothetical protein